MPISIVPRDGPDGYPRRHHGDPGGPADGPDAAAERWVRRVGGCLSLTFGGLLLAGAALALVWLDLWLARAVWAAWLEW